MNLKPEEKICESCGKSFSCGANVGECWCFEVDLTKEQLENVAKDFENCLCKECLIEKKDIIAIV